MKRVSQTRRSSSRAASVAIATTALLLVVLCSIAPIRAAQVESGSEQTLGLIDGLRKRRLFDQAEFVCQQALASQPTDSPSLARFTIELIRVRTDQARLASPTQQDAAWALAAQAASDFYARRPDHPRKILVQLQNALLLMQRVETLRGHSASSNRSRARSNAALELSQQAKAQLLAIQKTAQQELINTRSGNTAPNSLTDAELAHLQRNVRFQLAICGFHRADLYPVDDTLNRTSAIADVIEQLQTLQRTNEAGKPLWWQTQLALVRAHRLANNLAESQTLLERTAKDDLRPTRRAWTAQILTEQVELMLAEGVDQDASDRVDQLVRLADRVAPSPVLDLACLRLVVAVAGSVADASQREPWTKRSQQLARRIGLRHGDWWGQQAANLADTVVAAGRSAKQVTDQLQRVMRTGQAALDAGEFAKALGHFETATTLAETYQLTDVHRTCVLSLSQALEKMGQHGKAAERQIALATASPEHGSSASIHLRGCWNLGQAVAVNHPNAPTKDHPNAPNKDSLTLALTQHLAMWPQSDTNDQARLWLGKRQLATDDLDAAVTTLLAVGPNSPHRMSAAMTAANALNDAQQDMKAGKIFAELATQYPNDRRVVLGLARTETQQALRNPGQNPDAIARSLKRWRTIAKRLKPESEGWFEAKLSVVRLLAATGQSAQAKQLLNYLNALPDGWRQSALAKEFDAMQQAFQ